MLSDSFFNKPKLDYTLVFPDVIGSLNIPGNPLYEHWFDDVFTHAKEMILSNRYMVAMSSLKNNKHSYIKDLVATSYDEIISDLRTAVCDADDYSCDEYGNVRTLSLNTDVLTWQARLDYVEDYMTPIRENMFYIAQNIFLVIFYEVYKFTRIANSRGVRIADITYIKIPDTDYYTVRCHLAQEVIKQYDTHWYDRLSLLYSV